MKVTISKIKNEYKDLKPNGHWFSKDTMGFFNSRLSSIGYAKGDDYYFISSEQFNCDSNRYYTIRKMDRNTGEIDTIGSFNELTKTEARRLLASELNWKVKDL